MLDRYEQRSEAGQQVTSKDLEVISTPPSLSPTAMGRIEGHSVFRSVEQLRLHHALDQLGWTGVIDELNDAAQLKNQAPPEPILVTTNGTIIAGFGRWRLAVLDRRHEIHCIEYPLSEDDALQFILTHHQSRRGWNAYVRICLALTLKPLFQKRALENMRVGGKYKGWAKLPEVQLIEVRQEVAKAAAVGARNVTNVETLLKLAHPRLRQGLLDGTLTINRAMHFSKLPRREQLEQFILYSEERATNRVIRRAIPHPKEEKARPEIATVLDALQQQELREPGSVLVQAGCHRHTVILVGRDVLPSHIL